MARDRPGESPVARPAGTDLDLGSVRRFGIAVAMLLVVASGTAYLLLGGFRIARAPERPAAAPVSGGDAFPRLQDLPAGDLAQYRREKSAELESYGWVDRSRGVVRVPIEQAMRELAAAPAGGNSGRTP